MKKRYYVNSINGKLHLFDRLHGASPVGEVSPGATWVKHGDEFNDASMGTGEIQIYPVYKGDSKVAHFGSARQHRGVAFSEEVEKYIVGVRCPTCKTIH